MNSRQKQVYWAWVILVAILNIAFWSWWLKPEHVGSPLLFFLMSLALFYETTVLPCSYLFFLGHIKKPPVLPPPSQMKPGVIGRVAMVTLTVPGSESLEIVERQLKAMAKVRYKHESWILVDKVHSPEIKALAKKHGVHYFCRMDKTRWGKAKVAKWNQLVAPFKTKTKAGNVNAWIDRFGYRYTHFTQLDIDHNPIPSYLDKVLGYFADRKVAWVQAPSVYGNLDNWTARGSAEQELVLQGPLQMGFYGYSKTPFIIGSHCTYNMADIKKIGGFQPTRAEDHLDTVFLAANGKEGVFLPEIIAVGDGPENFETYLAQQFAWAYSMIQVLFKYTPRCLSKYTFRQGVQFLFVQTWYPLWSLSMLLLFILPLVSLLTNKPISHVDFSEFMALSVPLTVSALGVWLWSHRWHQPKKVFLSWRGIVLHIARWPVILSAFIQVILNVQKPYMITAKGMGNEKSLSISAHIPYFILIIVSIAACWFYLLEIQHSSTQGYLLFALQGAFLMLLIYATVFFKSIHDLYLSQTSLLRSYRLLIKPFVVLLVLVVALEVTLLASYRLILSSINYENTQAAEHVDPDLGNNTSDRLVIAH